VSQQEMLGGKQQATKNKSKEAQNEMNCSIT
jgi:hypothetical protein